jgi:mediator of RNA polymerase II transcription subunit 6
MDEESLCFFDQNFISQKSLTQQNVLEYFSLSQFYDRSCLNEILKMQSQFANIDISNKITEIIGIYYALEPSPDGIFIIAKKENLGKKTIILKVYYCIFGYVYCAPTLKSLTDSRSIDCLAFLNNAIDKYQKKKSFHWLKGFQFKAEEKANEINQDEIKFLFEILHEFDAKNRN